MALKGRDGHSTAATLRSLPAGGPVRFDGTTRELLPGGIRRGRPDDGPRLGFQKVPDPPLGEKPRAPRLHVKDLDAGCCAPPGQWVGRSAEAFAGWCWLTPRQRFLRGKVNNEAVPKGAKSGRQRSNPSTRSLNSAMALPIVAGQPE